MMLLRHPSEGVSMPYGRKAETPSGYTSMPYDRKAESNSVGNQRELIRAFIHEQQDMELYDIYVEEYLLRLLKALPRVNLRNIGLCRINCIKVILISYCLELAMGSRKIFLIRKELDNNSSSILF